MGVAAGVDEAVPGRGDPASLPEPDRAGLLASLRSKLNIILLSVYVYMYSKTLYNLHIPLCLLKVNLLLFTFVLNELKILQWHKLQELRYTVNRLFFAAF